MISRFTSIKGVGRFQDCSLGGRNFSKNTIIFGQNTGGKSTLTDILWSFKKGNKAIIEGRKTFGFTGNQIVEFYDENNKLYKFPSTEWEKGFDKIEIFDTQFINENIFEGNEISYEHQKNLNSIIIGTKGKEIDNKIKDLQDELSQLTTRKIANTNEFNIKLKNEISLKEFIRLPIVENVDEKIKEIKATIETANNQIKIKDVFEKIIDALINVINQNTKKILSDSIQVNAQKVTEHILKTWKNPDNSKDFLLTGLNLTKDEKSDCVFCGQELSPAAKDLLTAYSQLFSEEYKLLHSEISNAVIKFEKWNPTAFFESIHDKLASISLILDASIYDNEEINKLKKAVDNEFANKMKDITYEVNFDNYESLLEIVKKVKLQIEELKSKNVFKEDINIEQLKSKIKEFEFSKLRHTKEWDDFVKGNDNIDKSQKTKTKDREDLRKDLSDYSSEVFLIHFDTINIILEKLNADFKISSFQPIKNLKGQHERIFTLVFFNKHNVSLGETATDKPNFQNTLSESDKRVLAFAFFYSLMIHDPNLDEKIIVFDDPFSSFDSNRRLRTVELLANPSLQNIDGTVIKKSINQLIILTHEKEFYKWIIKKLDSTSTKPLKIIPDGECNGVKKSNLIDCDVEKDFPSDENINDLNEINEAYISLKPILHYGELCKKSRIILESIFKHKYLFELENEIKCNKSVRTFVKKLRELQINDYTNDAKYKERLFLCDNLNIELHDNSFTNEGENARAVLGDFLKIIKEV